MMTNCILVDIDGTLADCAHRRHHVEKDPKDWDSFLDPSCVINDPVIVPVAHVVLALRLFHSNVYGGGEIIYCSGRKDELRDTTIAWLESHNLWFPPYQLFMRKTGDYRPDNEVKRDLLQQIREMGYKPVLAIDDRSSVVKMWREEGLVCLQAAPGDF